MPSFTIRVRNPLQAVSRLPGTGSQLVAATAMPVAIEQKSSKAQAPFAKIMRQSLLRGEGRAGAQTMTTLRNWSRRNEWLRIAINRRKRQVSQARWHIVRIDDPTKDADPRVVEKVSKLFRYVNPKRESFRSLLDMVLEDLLVGDCGVIEKVKALGDGSGNGEVLELYSVDGATIAPDPAWDGSNPSAIRYRQYINDKCVASWRNDQMVYMMATPTSYSHIGWSPVETLVRSIEADLYGDDYDYEMLRQIAPAGLLDLGAGLQDQDVDSFRDYWQDEIEGQRAIAIMGGGAEGIDRAAQWIPMQRSANDLGREHYRTWLATKIAAAFELDLGVFNLTANMHKDTGGHQQALTDEGHKSFGMLVEEYVSREIVWEFDEGHAFRLSDLNTRDAAEQSELDLKGINMGALVPNEIRKREGRAPLPYGDYPWIPTKGPWTGESTAGQKPDDEGMPGLTPPLPPAQGLPPKPDSQTNSSGSS